MISAAAKSSLLAIPTRLASGDASTANDIALGLVNMNPRLQDPSTDVVTEIVNMSGALSSMFTTRFGERDLLTQQLALEQLLRQLFAIHDRLDSVSEVDMTKLQALMDRRSTFAVALSNLMKKISDTSQSIISNMK